MSKEEETMQTEKDETEKVKSKGKAKKKEAAPSREEELQKQLEEQKDQFLRLAAEYDNFRKRSAKEKDEARADEKAVVLKAILPVLDNFERAASNTDASYEDYRKGVELIFNQFTELLGKTGVKAFGEVGDPFDPNIHNAVMVVENEDLGENVIAQVFQKGYKTDSKLIRAAVVQVANCK